MSSTFLNGVVVSAKKMDKSVMVAVYKKCWHKKYGKQFVKTSKIMVHDPLNQCDIGDKIKIRKCRPYSKRKSFILYEILVKDPEAKFLKEHPEYKISKSEKKKERLKGRKIEELPHIKELGINLVKNNEKNQKKSSSEETLD